MRIVGHVKGRIEDKRFRLPGLTVFDDCPKCQKPRRLECHRSITWGESDYLSHTEIGAPLSLIFYCEDCDHNWSRKVVLRVTLEEA